MTTSGYTQEHRQLIRTALAILARALVLEPGAEALAPSASLAADKPPPRTPPRDRPDSRAMAPGGAVVAPHPPEAPGQRPASDMPPPPEAAEAVAEVAVAAEAVETAGAETAEAAVAEAAEPIRPEVAGYGAMSSAASEEPDAAAVFTPAPAAGAPPANLFFGALPWRSESAPAPAIATGHFRIEVPPPSKIEVPAPPPAATEPVTHRANGPATTAPEATGDFFRRLPWRANADPLVAGDDEAAIIELPPADATGAGDLLRQPPWQTLADGFPAGQDAVPVLELPLAEAPATAAAFFRELPWRMRRQAPAAPVVAPGSPLDPAGEHAAGFFHRLPWRPRPGTPAPLAAAPAPEIAPGAEDFFRRLPWSGAETSSPVAEPGADRPSGPAPELPRQPDGAERFFHALPWTAGSARPPAEAAPAAPQHAAAAIFPPLPRSAAAVPEFPDAAESPRGLGAAMMLAATRSALRSAARLAGTATPAAGYFQALPWRRPAAASGRASRPS